jgi:hypothetical protein
MKAAARMIAVALSLAAPAARAFCIYNDVFSAKTSIPQEFRDSKWVVRAIVLSAKDKWSDEEDSWAVYVIKVTHAYKGKPPKYLRFFTYRDSGGFYMDRPWMNLPDGHDIGGTYLLFLNPIGVRKGDPTEAKGAVFVNYSCGVSGPWEAVRPSARRMLENLERNPQMAPFDRPTG